jgi:hypothetical protein
MSVAEDGGRVLGDGDDQRRGVLDPRRLEDGRIAGVADDVDSLRLLDVEDGEVGAGSGQRVGGGAAGVAVAGDDDPLGCERPDGRPRRFPERRHLRGLPGDEEARPRDQHVRLVDGRLEVAVEPRADDVHAEAFAQPRLAERPAGEVAVGRDRQFDEFEVVADGDAVGDVRRDRGGHLLGQAPAEELPGREHLVRPGSPVVAGETRVLDERDDGNVGA